MGAPTRPAYDLQSGVVEFRPMSFTDILDGSFALFRSSVRVLVPLTLLVMVPVQLLSAFLQRDALSFGFGGFLEDPTVAGAIFGDGGLTAGLVVAFVLQILLGPLLAGGLAWVMGMKLYGNQVSVREAVLMTGRRAGWLSLAYLGGGLIRSLGLLLGAVSLAAGSEVLGAALLVLGGLLFVALTPLLAVLTPAIMLEQRPRPQAIRHAVGLTWRAYGKTVGVMLGTSLVFLLLASLLGSPFSFLGFTDFVPFAWVLAGIGSILSNVIVAPLTAGAMVLLHADLQMRQEGLDFDILLAQLDAEQPAGRS